MNNKIYNNIVKTLVNLEGLFKKLDRPELARGPYVGDP